EGLEARDMETGDDRQVAARRPVRDVRRGQPRDLARALLEPDEGVGRTSGGHDVPVHELDARRWPGGPRGVDERQVVVRGDGAPRGLDVEPRVRALDVGEG